MRVSPVDAYLTELDARLRGPRHRKRDLLQEAADHLVDATEANEANGLTRTEAEREAVREFGDTGTIAPAYQAILSVDQSRRLGIALLVVMAVQPFAWAGWHAAIGPNAAAAHGSLADRLDDLVELTGLITIAFASFAVVGCRIGLRFLGIREWMLRLALTGALISSLLIVAISAAMLATGGPITAAAVGFVAAVVWIPLTSTAVASVLALHAVDAAAESD